MSDNNEYGKSLGDQNAFGGHAPAHSVEQMSLGDQATCTGRMDVEGNTGSLGDQATMGIRKPADDALYDDGWEVVDLATRYKIEKVLGKGGMGEVLLATDTRLNRKVAIKRMLGQATQNKTAVTRFLTEAQAIAALNHPNIVQIYDYGRASDGPFLIMEFVEGRSLLERCKEGAMPLSEAIELTCQLCDGLGKAHASGIVHRDIKPANVLLTMDGVAKLTDFGLAKAVSSDVGMTIAGAVLGTIDFMPPEQHRDATQVDARSDLWSLAATLYQMVTGKSPKVIRLNDVPKPLQEVLGKALEDKQDDRYQAAWNFKDALRASQAASQNDVASEEGDCPHCAAKNPTHRKFCRNPGCGKPLEVPCLLCHHKIPMWEHVCDNCGTKQKEHLEERRRLMSFRQCEAENLLKSCDFDGSMRLTISLRDEPDLRLQHLRKWADLFVAEIEWSRTMELERLSQIYAEAKVHEQANDYSSALRALGQVPVPLLTIKVPGRNTTAHDLRTVLQRTLDEIKRLDVSISRRVANRELSGLVTEVARLRQLQPNRTDLASLHEQLIERDIKLVAVKDDAYSKAVSHLASQEYVECLTELARIDNSLVDSSIEEMRLQSQMLRNRLESLRTAITDRIREKQLNGLRAIVEEALSLKSESQDLETLREQLVAWESNNLEVLTQLTSQALALRSQCRFTEALTVLADIPKELSSAESVEIEISCQQLLSQRSAAMQSLAEAISTGKYTFGLSKARMYRETITECRFTDAEFDGAYASCRQLADDKRALAEEERKRRVALLLASSMAMIALVITASALGLRSYFRHHRLQRAIHDGRWEDALSIDPFNVDAIVGRAEKCLDEINGIKVSVNDTNPLRTVAQAERHLRDVDDKLSKIRLDIDRAASIGLGEPRLSILRQRAAAKLDNVRQQVTKVRDFAAESKRLAVEEEEKIKRQIGEAEKLRIADVEENKRQSENEQRLAERNKADMHIGRHTNSIGIQFNMIIAGRFTMGTSAVMDEGAIHDVTITHPYWMGATEVTQRQYEIVMAQNPSRFKDAANPVDSVSWEDAVEFCDRLSSMPSERSAGRMYRLPSEAEWEYACRADSRTVFSFGDNATQLANYAWYRENSLSESHAVAQKKPNAWGIYDMHGNVWEWCMDWHDVYPEKEVVDPLGPRAGTYRVCRGGSWGNAPASCGSAIRNALDPTFRLSSHGFRLVMSFVDKSIQNETKLRPEKKQVSAYTRAKWEKWLTSKNEEFNRTGAKNNIGIRFKLLPAGRFLMGSSSGVPSESFHEVSFSHAVWMGATEVTQEQYTRIMGDNPSRFRGPNHPVEQVSWEDAVEFCHRLSSLPSEVASGRRYRLPTEAEWEYACRAGTATEYCFGDRVSQLSEYSWYEQNSLSTTHRVGEKKPNAWGLYDMHGNVWEWCSDWRGDELTGAVVDPTGPTSGTSRVFRGGSWADNAGRCRSAYRNGLDPPSRWFDGGFRLVLQFVGNPDENAESGFDVQE